jgi:hypothetical protein
MILLPNPEAMSRDTPACATSEGRRIPIQGWSWTNRSTVNPDLTASNLEPTVQPSEKMTNGGRMCLALENLLRHSRRLFRGPFRSR